MRSQNRQVFSQNTTHPQNWKFDIFNDSIKHRSSNNKNNKILPTLRREEQQQEQQQSPLSITQPRLKP